MEPVGERRWCSSSEQQRGRPRRMQRGRTSATRNVFRVTEQRDPECRASQLNVNCNNNCMCRIGLYSTPRLGRGLRSSNGRSMDKAPKTPPYGVEGKSRRKWHLRHLAVYRGMATLYTAPETPCGVQRYGHASEHGTWRCTKVWPCVWH